MGQHLFANGTEGDAWFSKWCNNCIHEDDPCDVQLQILLEEDVPEIKPQPEGEFHFPPAHECTVFVRKP